MTDQKPAFRAADWVCPVCKANVGASKPHWCGRDTAPKPIELDALRARVRELEKEIESIGSNTHPMYMMRGAPEAWMRIEREECAKLADIHAKDRDPEVAVTAREIADAIRARTRGEGK